MPTDAMLWNKDKTESVRASKIRSFGIYSEYTIPPKSRSKLLGWFSANEYFHFGFWDTEDEARTYLVELHKQIEGR